MPIGRDVLAEAMVRIFYGPDTYRSREAYHTALSAAERRAGTPALVLRDEALTPAAVHAALEGQSLFGVVPPVALERLTSFSHTQAERIADVLQGLPRDREVFVWEDGTPLATGVVWRALESVAGDRSVWNTLSESEVIRWIGARATASGRTVEPAAVRELYAACGADLWSLSSELEKLFLLKPKGVLTSADVREVVSTPPRADVFGAVNAIVQRDRVTALQRLATSRRAGEDLRRLFTLVLRDLRRLLRIRGGLDSGEALSPWSLAHEFHIPRAAAGDLLRTAQATTTPRLRSLLDRLIVAYFHLNTGRAEAGEVLESLALGHLDAPPREKPSHRQARG